MKLVWKYLKKYNRLLISAIGFAAVARIVSLLDFKIFRLLVDDFIVKSKVLGRAEFVSGIMVLLLVLAAIALVTRFSKYWQYYFSNLATQKISSDLYAGGLSHVFLIPYRNFEDQKSAEIMQKLNHARETIQIFIFSFINGFFLSVLGVVVVIIFAFAVDPLLGAAFLLVSSVLMAVIFVLSFKTKSAQRAINRKTTILAGAATETLRNVELVKGMGLEWQETARLHAANDELLRLNIRKIDLIRRLDLIQGLLINSARISIMFLMLWLIYEGNMTLGEFFSMFFYASFIFTPLSDMGAVAVQYHETVAALEQMESILDIPTQTEPAGGLKAESIKSLDLAGVSFRYGENGEAGVRDVSLTASAGETIAFVGPSGCGKTTLVKLITGLYKPSHGSLRYNGVDSTEMDFNHLRRKIGLVTQESQLFAGSIRDNLLFVKPEATEQECLEALKNTLLTGIIERGSNGLDTVIGEGGMKLSGGERQRLAIARALLRKPDLLIFDEATSSLDSLTEREITQTIRQIESASPKLITILVAHRLSTVAHAKTIYVLDQGSVAASGSHSDLIAQNGLYACLWKEQVNAAQS